MVLNGAKKLPHVFALSPSVCLWLDSATKANVSFCVNSFSNVFILVNISEHNQ